MANPAGILEFRPDRCGICGHVGIWHLHDQRPRCISIDGLRTESSVFRVRCPRRCETTTLLPEGILPRVRYSVETVGSAIASYREPDTSYRSVAFDLVGESVPPSLTQTTIWGNAKLRSPYPSSVFRWVERFAAGARPRWPAILAWGTELTAQPIQIPPAPVHLARKARNPAKQDRLIGAWFLLYLLTLLTGWRGEPARRWPYLLLQLLDTASCLDHTGWFTLPARGPP